MPNFKIAGDARPVRRPLPSARPIDAKRAGAFTCPHCGGAVPLYTDPAPGRDTAQRFKVGD